MLPDLQSFGLRTLSALWLNFSVESALEEDDHGAVPSSRRKYMGAGRGTLTKVRDRNESG
jgi:hypothetical protein